MATFQFFFNSGRAKDLSTSLYNKQNAGCPEDRYTRNNNLYLEICSLRRHWVYTITKDDCQWAHARMWGMDDNIESFPFQQCRPDVCIPKIFVDINFALFGRLSLERLFLLQNWVQGRPDLSLLLFFVMAALLY